MGINLIAILLSLAMMLTGAGEAGAPAEVSRTLVLSNVTISHNGEAVKLAPSLRLGASTDGEKAVFDFGVDLNGEKLLPIQLGVSESGVVALAANSGEAVGLSAAAVETALENSGLSLEGLTQPMEGENSELMRFITEEYIPAYLGLIEAVQNEEFAKRLEEKGDAIFAEVIDRGEGKPYIDLVEGEEMTLTRYTYTLDGAKLAELVDAVYTGVPELSDYYNATFKLYAMLPEESGLNGISSFSELFEKNSVDMTMELDERMSDDGAVKLTDAVLTIDMSSAVAVQQAQLAKDAEEGDAVELPELPPLVMNVHSVEIGEKKESSASFEYAMDEGALGFSVSSTQRDGMTAMNMSMNGSQEGAEFFSMNMSASDVKDSANGDNYYSVVFDASVADQGKFDFAVNGFGNVDGSSRSNVTLSGESGGESVALSFDLDVETGAIEDLANGHEAFMIEDLSEKGMSALGEDQSFLGTIMKATGSLSADAGKLMADESVQKLMGLFTATIGEPAEPVDGAGYDYTYEIEDVEYEDAADVEGDFGYEYEEPEDDGVLGFEIPTFGWLPEGWDVLESNADTAYDWVDITVGEKNRAKTVYAMFFLNDELSQTNYLVSKDGGVSPVEGREITVTDFGDGGLSVTLIEGKMNANLFFNAEDTDLETIGQIVAGIQF